MSRNGVPNVLRGLLHLLLFGAGFVLVVEGVREVAPLPLKEEWLLAQEEPVNALFVGSSRTYRHVDPALFDRLMREAGEEVRSLNMGKSGMWLAESLQLAETLVELDIDGLEYLVVEVSNVVTEINEANLFTSRMIAWHDWPRTRVMVERSIEEGEWKLAERHLVHWAYRFTNLGMGEKTVRHLLEVGEPDWSTKEILGPRLDGFRSLADEDGKGVRRRRREFLDQLDRWPEVVGYMAIPFQDGPAALDLLPLWGDLVEKCEERGIHLAFVLMPGVRRQDLVRRLFEQGFFGNLIVFNDPRRWPEFYAVENRFDRAHLNRRGAALLTRALVQEILRQRSDAR